MKVEKIFLTHAEQLEYLIEKKGLTVTDREKALDMLRSFGYFALVDGYKAPFKCPDGDRYRDGTSLDDIVALFKMDENLRELFFKYIMRVELKLRSLLSYYFTEKHGHRQEEYLRRENYIEGSSHDRGVFRTVSKLRDLVKERGKFDYINHYIENYQNVPLWVLVNALSLGVLVNLYDCQTPDIKAKTADMFSVSPSDLASMLDVLNRFRNVSAHNERLYSCRSDSDICDTPLHEKYRVKRDAHGHYASGKHDLFAAAISLETLLEPDDAEKFKRGLHAIIGHFTAMSQVIPKREFWTLMGFTEEYFG